MISGSPNLPAGQVTSKHKGNTMFLTGGGLCQKEVPFKLFLFSIKTTIWPSPPPKSFQRASRQALNLHSFPPGPPLNLHSLPPPWQALNLHSPPQAGTKSALTLPPPPGRHYKSARTSPPRPALNLHSLPPRQALNLHPPPGHY